MANDRVKNQRVVSAGGLNTLNNYLTLSIDAPGAAIQLQNFESSLAGGYRRINGYRELDEGFSEVQESGAPTGEGPILGVWKFFNTTTNEYMTLAARKDIGVDTYSIYKHNLGVDWEIIDTLTLATESLSGFRTVNKVRAEVVNFGTVNTIIFVDGVNNAYYYNGTNWFQIDPGGTGANDANAGGPMALESPSYITIFRNHIFMSGDEANPGVIAHSAPEFIYDWTAATGAGQVVAGFDVVMIRPFRDEMYFFGEEAIKKISVNSSLDFVSNDVTYSLGCIASDSVLEIGGNLIFLSHDGIRPIAGTERINDVELQLLSGEIQDIIDEILVNYDLNNLSSVVIKGKTQFRLFFSGPTDDDMEGYGIMGCWRNDRLGQRWEFSTIYGIRVSSTWSGLVGAEEEVLHGGYDGLVYQQEVGNTFNGNDITAIYSTPYLDMGDTERRKSMRECNLYVKNEGEVTINMGVNYDWGDPEAINPDNYSTSMGGGIMYDDPDAIYDDASTVYGGAGRQTIIQPIQGSGYSVQYSFNSTGGAPYTIHGFVHEFTVEGRA